MGEPGLAKLVLKQRKRGGGYAWGGECQAKAFFVKGICDSSQEARKGHPIESKNPLNNPRSKYERSRQKKV